MNLIPIHKNIYIPDFRFETKYKSKKVFYTVKAFLKAKGGYPIPINQMTSLMD